MKPTSEIIYSETGEKVKNDDIQSLNINGVNINNEQSIAEVFNNYFLIITDNITKNNISSTSEDYTKI
jgi:hypothetical protein